MLHNIKFPFLNEEFKSFKIKGFDVLKYKKAERIDTEHCRLYKTPDNNLYPSVTSVLGHVKNDDLVKWKAAVGEIEAQKISSRATRYGTTIHNLAEKYMLNTLHINEVSFLHLKDFMILKNVLDKHVNNIVAIELPMYSDYLKSAGTIDLVAEFDNTLSIIDFKTSKERKHEQDIENYFKQISAYAYMMNEMFDLNINDAVIIMIVNNDTSLLFKIKCDKYLSLYKKDRFNFYKSVGV